MKKPLRKNTKVYVAWTCIFLAGLVLGMVIRSFWTIKIPPTTIAQSDIKPIRDQSGGFNFISPLLAYDIPEAVETSKLKGLEKEIEHYVQSQKDSEKISRASVYIKRLNSGRWVGLNENEQYTPASLFKVPLMIAYLKTAEKQPDVLSKTLTKTSTIDENSGEFIRPPQSIKQNVPYKIEDLLNYMIQDSDNNAAMLLYNSADKNFFKKIFSDLAVPLPQTDQEQDFITVEDFAFFFRILFNGTYLDRDLSEKALKILSQTSFKDGLVKGVPENIVVSHKFGEYDLVTSGVLAKRQLHDCGIVYYPAHPYLLCVMTEGGNLDNMKNTISHISEMVYNQTDAESKAGQ